MRFRSSLSAVMALALTGLVTAGCVAYGGPYSGPGYAAPAHSEAGTIVSARHVMVRSDGSGGAVVGAVIGGTAGAALGGDTGGSIAGGIAGALIGGLLGSEMEKSASEHEAIEYVIELDSGRTVTVLQDPSQYFPRGSRVRVIFGDHVRLVPLRSGPPPRGGPRGGAPEWQPDDGGAYGEDDAGPDEYYEDDPEGGYEEGAPGEGEYDEDYPG